VTSEISSSPSTILLLALSVAGSSDGRASAADAPAKNVIPAMPSMGAALLRVLRFADFSRSDIF
jgi:hypothetical protein